jgi:hypothetical protein
MSGLRENEKEGSIWLPSFLRMSVADELRLRALKGWEVRQAPERFEEVGALLRGIDSFQVIQHRGKEATHLPTGLSDECVGRFFREELGTVKLLGFFKMLACALDVAASHMLDTGNSFVPEHPVIAGDGLEIQPVRVSLRNNRIQVPCSLKRFAEPAQSCFEVLGATVMVASRPEQFHELVTMYPLIRGYQEITEEKPRLLALP